MPANLPTPIPVGSPLPATPPAFDRWGIHPSRAARLDKRDYSRRKLSCDLWLIHAPSQCVFRCKTDDISDAGLHATAPIGYGLAVGQRYELRIAQLEHARAMSAPLARSLGYATVVRTEMHVHGDRLDRVGFAVRFDVPQLLPL
jgi:hypothetical protein